MSDREFYTIDESEYLYHYGTPRHSGRYPWGSGKNPYQGDDDILAQIEYAKSQGLKTDSQIAKSLGMTVSEFRARRSFANDQERNARYYQAVKLRNKGMSYQAIADRLGMPNESSARSLLNRQTKERTEITNATADVLKKSVEEKKYIDIGLGVETEMGISQTKLNTAVQKLKDEGYVVYNIPIEQLGTGKTTTVKVLCPPGTTFKEVAQNKGMISNVADYYSDDGGRHYEGKKPVQSVSSDRIYIRYAEDGGKQKDGVIELRRGVEDLDMGNSKYAQVRIGVDDTHYLKGMAIYSNDIPEGYDIVFNTNKTKDVPMLGDKYNSVLKPMKKGEDGNVDQDNPFGAAIKPGGQKGALNIVYEEGDWQNWSRTLSSQFLSKQYPSMAETQLKIVQEQKEDEFNEIMALTNPAIKKRLLVSFADGCDSDAVHLKAAALPRQASHVILPVPEIKENEIYAPQYENGEEVVLVRYPHQGIFEIPVLTVNNKQKDANEFMHNAKDAVGIHPKVAQRLSGADFDGDTVLVIPTKGQKIKTSGPLKGLENFDPSEAYPGGKEMGLPEVGVPKKKGGDGFNKGMEMGKISNLITDMTFQGASPDELARAVRHAQVVIDAEKHQLNWKQSEIDNDIADLRKRYQGKETGGAATLISKAKSVERVPQRKDWFLSDSTVDEEGNKIYRLTNKMHYDKSGNLIPSTTKSTKMAEAKDARELSSGTVMEEIYADHANKLKDMARTARLEALKIPSSKKNPDAAKAYADEVESVNAKLELIKLNKPRERQAQIQANVTYFAKKRANPEMDSDQAKKVKQQALRDAREAVGAISKKDREMKLTDREWEAFQAGAFSNHQMEEIINNMDLDDLKQLATPRQEKTISESKKNLIRSMNMNGYSIAEIADRAGVSTSTVSKYLGE